MHSPVLGTVELSVRPSVRICLSVCLSVCLSHAGTESGQKLLLMANRKSHTPLRFVPKSTTLNDLERPMRTLLQTRCFGVHHKNLNLTVSSKHSDKHSFLTRPINRTNWCRECTHALMAVLRSTWQSSVIQALTDVQEWNQLTVGSSTYCARRLHLVAGRSPSLVHAPGTTYLMPSEIRLCHSWHSQKLLKSYLFVWLPRRVWLLTGALQMY